jgi:hypothetical protein
LDGKLGFASPPQCFCSPSPSCVSNRHKPPHWAAPRPSTTKTKLVGAPTEGVGEGEKGGGAEGCGANKQVVASLPQPSSHPSIRQWGRPSLARRGRPSRAATMVSAVGMPPRLRHGFAALPATHPRRLVPCSRSEVAVLISPEAGGGARRRGGARARGARGSSSPTHAPVAAADGVELPRAR